MPKPWGAFFREDIGAVIFPPLEEKYRPESDTDWWYGWLIRNFTGPTDNKAEFIKRTIYAVEGARAQNQADAMEAAITQNRNHYEACKQLVKNIGNQPHGGDAKRNALILAGAINRKGMTIESGELDRLAASILNEFPVLNDNNDVVAITDYLRNRLAFETNPENQTKKFKEYVYPHGLYAKLSSEHLLPNLVKPTFGNTIGANIIHPGYILDALCDVPYRAVTGLIDKICKKLGGEKNNKVASGFKFFFTIFPVPLVALKIATHTFAKLTTISGWKEMGEGIKSAWRSTKPKGSSASVNQVQPLAGAAQDLSDNPDNKLAKQKTVAIRHIQLPPPPVDLKLKTDIPNTIPQPANDPNSPLPSVFSESRAATSGGGQGIDQPLSLPNSPAFKTPGSETRKLFLHLPPQIPGQPTSPNQQKNSGRQVTPVLVPSSDEARNNGAHKSDPIHKYKQK